MGVAFVDLMPRFACVFVWYAVFFCFFVDGSLAIFVSWFLVLGFSACV